MSLFAFVSYSVISRVVCAVSVLQATSKQSERALLKGGGQVVECHGTAAGWLITITRNRWRRIEKLPCPLTANPPPPTHAPQVQCTFYQPAILTTLADGSTSVRRCFSWVALRSFRHWTWAWGLGWALACTPRFRCELPPLKQLTFSLWAQCLPQASDNPRCTTCTCIDMNWYIIFVNDTRITHNWRPNGKNQRCHNNWSCQKTPLKFLKAKTTPAINRRVSESFGRSSWFQK